MTSKHRIMHLAAALGVMAFAGAVPVTGSAQQLDKPARAAKSDQGAAASRPGTKPIERTKRSQNSRATETQAQQWTLQDAMPDHSAAMRYYAPETTGEFGRVPLQSGPGSFGFTTDNKIKANQLPDGRTVPSLETSSRQSPSYVGLSLSVPTSDKSLHIPVPFGAQW